MSEKIKKDRREFLAQAGALVVGTMVAGNAMAGLTARPTGNSVAKPAGTSAAKPTAVRQMAQLKAFMAKNGTAPVGQLVSPFSNKAVDRVSIVTGDVAVARDLTILVGIVKNDIQAGKYELRDINVFFDDMSVMHDSMKNQIQADGQGCPGEEGGEGPGEDMGQDAGKECTPDSGTGSGTPSNGDNCGGGCPDASGTGCGNKCGSGSSDAGDGCNGDPGNNCSGEGDDDQTGQNCGNECKGGGGVGTFCQQSFMSIFPGYESILNSFVVEMHGNTEYTVELIEYNRGAIINELVAPEVNRTISR